MFERTGVFVAPIKHPSASGWFWSGLNGYLNTRPNRVFGALGLGQKIHDIYRVIEPFGILKKLDLEFTAKPLILVRKQKKMFRKHIPGPSKGCQMDGKGCH